MIVGNATGSAIAQGSLVLGVAGLAGYIRVAPRIVWRDGLTLMLAIGLAAALALDGVIDRLEGAALLIAYRIYLVAVAQAEHIEKEPPCENEAGAFRDPLAIALGLVLITLSAHTVVTSGASLAVTWGVSQTLVGVLVIAIGTSLPELVLSAGAASKGHGSLSAANVIGRVRWSYFVGQSEGDLKVDSDGLQSPRGPA